MTGELFLAWRYLRPRRNALSIITVLSILGVTLGVAVLMIVLAVMTGFTDEMKEKLLQTQAHLQIRSRYDRYIADPGPVLDALFALGGSGGCVVESFVMLQNGQRMTPKSVMGLDPADFQDKMQLDSVLRYGSFDLNPGDIVISEAIARELGLRLGSRVLVHSQEHLSTLFEIAEDGEFQLRNQDEIYLPKELTVRGIYSFAKYDFDKSVVFVNLDDAAELFHLPWGAVTAVYGYLPDPFAMEQELDALQEQLPLMRVISWKDLNRQLLGVLEMEKTMMFFLLVFIVLVAAFSIANTLISSVYQKTREIGVLKALGASGSQILLTFVFQGTWVGIIGNVLGIAMGWSVIHWRNELLDWIGKIAQQDFFPKEFYFFSEMPAHIVPADVALIAVSSIVLCTLGAVLPALRAALLDPAKALRYE